MPTRPLPQIHRAHPFFFLSLPHAPPPPDEEDEEESLGSGEHDDEDEEEEDGLERPAAEAITLRLLEGGGGAGQGGGWEFAPEFTHQLFEGEEVPPGYPDLSVRCVGRASKEGGGWGTYV